MMKLTDYKYRRRLLDNSCNILKTVKQVIDLFHLSYSFSNKFMYD